MLRCLLWFSFRKNILKTILIQTVNQQCGNDMFYENDSINFVLIEISFVSSITCWTKNEEVVKCTKCSYLCTTAIRAIIGNFLLSHHLLCLTLLLWREPPFRSLHFLAPLDVLISPASIILDLSPSELFTCSSANIFCRLSLDHDVISLYFSDEVIVS